MRTFALWASNLLASASLVVLLLISALSWLNDVEIVFADLQRHVICLALVAIALRMHHQDK